MYKLYQVKKEKMHDFGFLSFEDAERYNGEGSVTLENYDLVYEFEMYSAEDIRLDDIYAMFNLHRPNDFTGHSMSASDVVEYDGSFYYCDDVGWKKLDWGNGGQSRDG